MNKCREEGAHITRQILNFWGGLSEIERVIYGYSSIKRYQKRTLESWDFESTQN